MFENWKVAIYHFWLVLPTNSLEFCFSLRSLCKTVLGDTNPDTNSASDRSKVLIKVFSINHIYSLCPSPTGPFSRSRGLFFYNETLVLSFHAGTFCQIWMVGVGVTCGQPKDVKFCIFCLLLYTNVKVMKCHSTNVWSANVKWIIPS